MPNTGWRSLTVTGEVYACLIEAFDRERQKSVTEPRRHTTVSITGFVQSVLDKALYEKAAERRLAETVKIPEAFLYDDGTIRRREWNEEYQCYVIGRRSK